MFQKGNRLCDLGTRFSGRHHSKESRAKMSRSRKGRIISPEHRQRIGEANRGSNNGLWKGDDVGHIQLHDWVKRNWPRTVPTNCQTCNKIKWYDLANITGIYNRDFSNWQFLCRSCHVTLDYSTGVRGRHS